MDDDTENPSGKSSPVRVDVKLGASVEVKTEIPSSASGRFVDTLTDIIRPFSERRGLRADQIRLQRETVLIDIAREARKRLAIENTPIKKIPSRFLIPYLETASREDLDSGLIEWWTRLLVAASSNTENQHPMFIDILSKFTPRVAKAVETLWSEITNYDCLTANEMSFSEYILISNRIKNKISSKEIESAIAEWRCSGIFCTGYQVSGSNDNQAHLKPPVNEPSIDVLVANGVLRRKTAIVNEHTASTSKTTFRVEYLGFTALGVSFMFSCAGQPGKPKE